MKICLKNAIMLLLFLNLNGVNAQTPFIEGEVRMMNEAGGTELTSVVDDLNSISDEIDSVMQTPEGSESLTDTSSESGMISVVRGNTLSGLARRLLGSARRWRELVEWNVDRYPSLLKNPDLILVGWKLRISPPGQNNSSGQNAQTAAVRAPANNNTSSSTGIPMDTSNSSASSSASSSSVSNAAGPLITPDSRVLHIGDSHTCGAYGKAMDALMRETGAAVRTYGVSGSSPSWWLNGTTGRSGYYSRDEQGRVDQPADWRTPRTTPNLNQLISEYKPNVIMFSLGANLVHASPATIRKQVETVCEIARKAGCKIVWVGPPNGRPGVRDPEDRARLYENLRAVAEQYGSFIDSRQFTRYPESGGDGVHYGGTEGTRVAREWADKVFDTIQKPRP